MSKPTPNPSTSSTSSNASTTSTRAHSPAPSDIWENLEVIQITSHTGLDSGQPAGLHPEIFIRPPDPQDPPVMIFPLDGTMAYAALEEELEDAMNTQMKSRIGQVEAVAGHAERHLDQEYRDGFDRSTTGDEPSKADGDDLARQRVKDLVNGEVEVV